MAQKILGLDLRADAVRGVVLEAALRGYEVRAQLTVPIEAPPAAEVEGEEESGSEERSTEQTPLHAALERLLEELGAKPEVVIAALPSFRSASPLLHLPFTETRKIEAILGFEVEGVLPFDIDDVIYDYQIVEQEENGSQLLVGVALEEEVRELLGTLEAVGLDPRVLTLPSLGTFTLLSELAKGTSLPGDETLAMLDIGSDRSLFAVSRGAASERGEPRLVFSRALENGLDDVAAELEDRLGLGAEEARERVLEGSLEAEDDPLVDGLAPLLRELRQSLRAAQTQSRLPIRRLVLTGEGARIPGLATFLGNQLDLEIVLPGELKRGEEAIVPEALEPEYAQAFGLALRGQQRSPRLLNLRQGDLAFRGDLDYLRGKLARIGAFAAIICLLLGAAVWLQFWSYRVQEQALEDALCQVTQRILGTCETDFIVATSKLQGGDTKASRIPSASALEVLGVAVNELTGEEAVELDVEELDASLDRLRIRGVVDSFDAVEQVEAALKKSECIGQVNRGRMQKNREEMIEFTLDAQYVCGQAGKVG